MCTVVILTLADGGWLVAGNRDERLTRQLAEPPRVHTERGVRFLAPTDAEEGGTWIAVNELGCAFSLLNNYEATAGHNPSAPISRGRIVRRLAHCANVEEVLQELASDAAPLTRVRPFVLVVASLGNGAELVDWDGRQLTSAPLLPPALVVSNSGELQRAIKERGATFARHRANWAAPCPTDEQLHNLFASHEPARGHVSICMHVPPFAKTMSLTAIRLQATGATMRYVAGSPCEPGEAVRAELGIVSS